MSGVEGVVVIDKQAGMTSHDVVARVRRLVGVRRVGHAGTLDPDATGVLVLGVGRATRLLRYLVADTKTYEAVVRLGWSTTTDDAAGDMVEVGDAARLRTLSADDVRAAALRLTGEIDQVPPAVSAIKVEGRRAHARVRAGEAVELAPRRVDVSRFQVGELTEATTEEPPYRDVAVTVDCSSGTYIRSLARDLGSDLGVAGHIRQLRRTRSGAFGLAQARTLDALAEDPSAMPVAEVLPRQFPVRVLTPDEAGHLSHGRRIRATGRDGMTAAIGPDGEAVALISDVGAEAKASLVFAPA